VKQRGQWQGMMTIALFNWPYYLAAGAVLVATLGGFLLSQSTGTRLICGVALGGAVYFLVGSLGVSHLIYDRSDFIPFRVARSRSAWGCRSITRSSVTPALMRRR
jgi:hypothetical protein